MKPHWIYFKYVLRHKWFVFKAGRRLNVGLWQLIIHDWTKFLPCEWFPYVNNFYNRDGSKRDRKTITPQEKAAFDAAWEHHWKHNKHHWQWWTIHPEGTPCEMDNKYIREMVADWVGAGQAITGKTDIVEWYAKQRNDITLAPVTRQVAESLVETFK